MVRFDQVLTGGPEGDSERKVKTSTPDHLSEFTRDSNKSDTCKEWGYTDTHQGAEGDHASQDLLRCDRDPRFGSELGLPFFFI